MFKYSSGMLSEITNMNERHLNYYLNTKLTEEGYGDRPCPKYTQKFLDSIKISIPPTKKDYIGTEFDLQGNYLYNEEFFLLGNTGCQIKPADAYEMVFGDENPYQEHPNDVFIKPIMVDMKYLRPKDTVLTLQRASLLSLLDGKEKYDNFYLTKIGLESEKTFLPRSKFIAKTSGMPLRNFNRIYNAPNKITDLDNTKKVRNVCTRNGMDLQQYGEFCNNKVGYNKLTKKVKLEQARYKHYAFSNPQKKALFYKIFYKNQTFYYTDLTAQEVKELSQIPTNSLPTEISSKIHSFLKVCYVQSFLNKNGINNRLMLNEINLKKFLSSIQINNIILLGLNEHSLVCWIERLRNEYMTKVFVARRRYHLTHENMLSLKKYDTVNVVFNVSTEPYSVVHCQKFSVNGVCFDIEKALSSLNSPSICKNDQLYFRAFFARALSIATPSMLRYAFVPEIKVTTARVKTINNIDKVSRSIYYHRPCTQAQTEFKKKSEKKKFVQILRNQIQHSSVEYSRKRVYDLMLSYSVLGLIRKSLSSKIYLRLVRHYKLPSYLRSLLFSRLIVSFKNMVFNDIEALFQHDLCEEVRKKTDSLAEFSYLLKQNEMPVTYPYRSFLLASKEGTEETQKQISDQIEQLKDALKKNCDAPQKRFAAFLKKLMAPSENNIRRLFDADCKPYQYSLYEKAFIVKYLFVVTYVNKIFPRSVCRDAALNDLMSAPIVVDSEKVRVDMPSCLAHLYDQKIFVYMQEVLNQPSFSFDLIKQKIDLIKL
jgi:hypothetical protein